MKKIIGWSFILVINYFLLFFLIYAFSGILLINNITPDIKLIKEYQRNYYNIGLRNIWHSKPECVEFSETNIYVPQKKSCNFDNIEFKTTISFNDKGRLSNHPANSNNNGIAVIGDSFAMGWGVNDNETFSHLLEKKINRPVYNLAVSGYGTVRELIRLKESKLLEKVNTVIIQYCFNDHGENVSYKQNKLNIAEKKYKLVIEGSKMSFWKKLRKSFRYSATIPIDILKKNNHTWSFDHHKEAFENVLKNVTFLNDKRIIVFYVNGHEQQFDNFPSEQSKIFKNLEYVDLEIENDPTNFYNIDGHLNSKGHSKIAEKISKLF